MAISPKLLQVAANDLATASMLAGMISANEVIKNGTRYAKFQKVGSRVYKITRGSQAGEMEDEVTSPAVAKMMVIQHVAVKEEEPAPAAPVAPPADGQN